MTYRLERLNSQLREEISNLVQHHVKNPRLGTMVSITSVEVSPDLRYAKVNVSRLGTPDEKRATLAALASASGYIRHELGDRLKTRRIPELSFRLDETIEKANRVLRIIDRFSPEEKSGP